MPHYTQDGDMTYDASPPLLAVDANGKVYRVYDKFWSACPTFTDNDAIARPVTFYEPQRFPFSDHIEEAIAAGELREVDAMLDDDEDSPAYGRWVTVYLGTKGFPVNPNATVEL